MLVKIAKTAIECFMATIKLIVAEELTYYAGGHNCKVMKFKNIVSLFWKNTI